jgi:hypothetical protein
MYIIFYIGLFVFIIRKLLTCKIFYIDKFFSHFTENKHIKIIKIFLIKYFT